VHFDGELAELRRRVGQSVRLAIELREPAASAELVAATGGLPVAWDEGSGLRHVARFNRTEVRAAEVIRLVVNDRQVQDLHLSEQPIEDVVREIYRQAAAGGGA
jgi:ABC-type uncharacterized transport system ATPase subunit